MNTKNITEVDKLEAFTAESEPTFYTESDGKFRRASAGQVKEIIKLGGIVVNEGMLCVEIEENGGEA